jgi:hypothetical protein
VAVNDGAAGGARMTSGIETKLPDAPDSERVLRLNPLCVPCLQENAQLVRATAVVAGKPVCNGHGAEQKPGGTP